TPDPLHAMQVRYQLRHSPGLCCFAVSRRSNLISLMHFRPLRQSALFRASPASPCCLEVCGWNGENQKIRRNQLIPADCWWS
ncbi:hypothetical protein, partial [Pseudarthrobacter sp. fls2-241-R2A-168]|uniref:hypothetical protein n=1 Tax=Pseudarthrobacter sp. fls2-241-R2A-168 TaxID=3040304 RepID=UPI002556083D